MPRIEPKRSFKVESAEQGEALESRRGFGDQEPMVRMMNLMMVEGSGMEGMDMSGTDMAPAQSEPAGHAHGARPDTRHAPRAEEPAAAYEIRPKLEPEPPRVGANVLEITVTDKRTGNPVAGLGLKAQVYMTGMDMGTDEPQVKEVAPGRYRTKVTFSMQGAWAVKLSGPDRFSKTFEFNVVKTAK